MTMPSWFAGSRSLRVSRFPISCAGQSWKIEDAYGLQELSEGIGGGCGGFRPWKVLFTPGNSNAHVINGAYKGWLKARRGFSQCFSRKSFTNADMSYIVAGNACLPLGLATLRFTHAVDLNPAALRRCKDKDPWLKLVLLSPQLHSLLPLPSPPAVVLQKPPRLAP